MNFPQLNSPLQELKDPLFEEKELRLFIKRDDLIHPEISGNKFRKLKYNLIEAKDASYPQILTFGGAYSNHIAATAAAGKMFGITTIGIIRGDEFKELNPTLLRAKENGMQLKFVSRKEYSNKNDQSFLSSLKEEFGDFHPIPEGGANQAALKGCAEIVSELHEEFNVICSSVGSGTSLAGIYSAIKAHQRAIGFSALKAGDYLVGEISKLLGKDVGEENNFQLQCHYHFGGYAKISADLVAFCNYFHQKHHVPLDLIYTAKMFYGIYDMIGNDEFKRGDRIIAVHTGGLQANKSMEKRYAVHLDY